MQKFIIDPETRTGSDVSITGQDARHICRVLRLKSGDPISMTDGKGTDSTGVIIMASPDHVRVKITEQKEAETESRLDLTLCTAMLKHNKMDEIVKQAVQLGVTRWVPFFSSRSVPLSNPKKEARQMERWQTIARESLKQCRRSRLLEIISPLTFEAVLEMTEGASHKIAFWEKRGLFLTELKGKPNTDAVILIGPEGGFEASEIRLAQEKGFTAYSLGPRILRAETAALCAAGLVQYILGDMGCESSD